MIQIPGINKDQIRDSLMDRLAYSRDASLYRLVPKAIIYPRSEKEIQALLKYARKTETPITFRTSGTSLSGQSISDGFIAEVIHDWKKYSISEDSLDITLQPGLVGARVNQILSNYQKRIGPDPASINAARIGGIISNNASGMCCGTEHNSYHTLKNIRFILANGHIYDTVIPEDYDRFKKDEKALYQGLINIRSKILHQDHLYRKIRNKYLIKNTIGYSLNSFLDYENPLDIFAHLLIGAEGTLAFVSEVTLKTIHDPPEKMTGLMLFDSMKAACSIISELKEMNTDSVELMDYASLTTAKYLDNSPYNVDELGKDSAGLLCEFQGDDIAVLKKKCQHVIQIVEQLDGKSMGGFSADPEVRLKLWKIRKSLYPTVGSLRKKGTSVITEDICFKVEDLTEAIPDLHHIFKKWHFNDAIIFGHAKDGNLHFVTSINLDTDTGNRNYEGMMDDLVSLVVNKYDGSLKAEHGTGRNMAPFVETEWGPELYEIMWDIKSLVDPHLILNPGVQLNRDNRVHLKHLKPMPEVHNEIDLCIECGFCEEVCPSKEFTLTPRQRIVVAREIELMKREGLGDLENVIKQYKFSGILTCAVDGLCETACPVNINTGLYIKDLRSVQKSKFQLIAARWTVKHFQFIQTLIRLFTAGASLATLILTKRGISFFTKKINRLSGYRIPSWNPYMPKAAMAQKYQDKTVHPDYIYYTSCINRTFSANGKRESLTNIICEIGDILNLELKSPDKLFTSCCSMPHTSKGFTQAGNLMMMKTVDMLYDETDNGRIPVLVDTSPCTYTFKNAGSKLTGELKEKWSRIHFIDIIQFLDEKILETDLPQLNREIVIHPNCSVIKMELVNSLRRIAEKCAEKVVIPEEIGCCAFAGDRGLIVPELTQSATNTEASYVKMHDKKIKGYSSSRTCEVGLTSATNRDYESIAVLVRDYLSQ